MPALYVVATPIGNLEDITLRALRILREVHLIAAEDTRTTRQLLRHYGIRTPLTSYHEHNKGVKIPYLLEALKSKDVALVSEAGMPGIRDPGYDLIRAALRENVPVVPVPGPSALTTALAVSGLPADRFTFLGFLPSRRAQRQRLLESIKREEHTLVAFEAPHRLQECLEDILATLGDRPIAVARELTKLHEELFRGNVSQAQAHFTQPRGEFTLVIAGAGKGEQQRDRTWAIEELRRLRDQGLKAREVVSRVAQASRLPRREVYRLWLDLGKP